MADPNRPVTGYPAPNSIANGPPPPSNTAYPYAVPPPSYTYAAAAPPPPPYYNNNNQQYYNPDPYAIQRANFLRRIFAVLIAAIIIAGTVLFIIWLVLRPKLPLFRVDSLQVSNFNISNLQLTATFDLRFTVRNPNNKISLSYDNIQTNVYYRNNMLSSTNLPPFSQSTRNETSLRAGSAAVSSYVDKYTADDINGERGKSGNLYLNVRMYMLVRFKSGVWRARRRILRVYCGDLAVGLSSDGRNGTLKGGPMQCRAGF